MSELSNLLIYVVEDDPDDRYLLQMTLASNYVASNIQFFTHGSELFVRLTHRLDGRLPDMILLDLETPIMNGFETLQLLKTIEEYRSIPVIIRSSFEMSDYINRCYELGCKAYVIKSAYPFQFGREMLLSN